MTIFLYIEVGILSGGETIFGNLLINFATPAGVGSTKRRSQTFLSASSKKFADPYHCWVFAVSTQNLFERSNY